MSTHKSKVYSATNPYPPTPVTCGFQPGEPFTLVRPVITTLAAAETGPFDATTFPPLTQGFACDRYETVYMGAMWTSGAGTVKITPMVFDPDAQIWVDLYVSGAIQASDALDGTGQKLSELRIFGRHCVFFRVSTLTGGPLTNVELYAMPGVGRSNAFFG
jgi:hypothetical protein